MKQSYLIPITVQMSEALEAAARISGKPFPVVAPVDSSITKKGKAYTCTTRCSLVWHHLVLFGVPSIEMEVVCLFSDAIFDCEHAWLIHREVYEDYIS